MNIKGKFVSREFKHRANKDCEEVYTISLDTHDENVIKLCLQYVKDKINRRECVLPPPIIIDDIDRILPPEKPKLCPYDQSICKLEEFCCEYDKCSHYPIKLEKPKECGCEYPTQSNYTGKCIYCGNPLSTPPKKVGDREA